MGPQDKHAVRVRSLQKAYNGADGVVAVDGISFTIERGTAVGILGPNGAGKTTTIKCLLGLILPTAGELSIGGIDVRKEPKRAYQYVGTTLEGARNTYWRLTAMENLEFFAALGGLDPASRRGRHTELLRQFGIERKADTVVRELSRGQKQKVALACTLARDAEVLFLDEPTLGLDIESSLELQRELQRLVDNEDTTILLTSHDMDVIENVCGRVIVLNNGKIVADDTVDHLMGIFERQEYLIRVTDDLPDPLIETLQNQFDTNGFERRSDVIAFRSRLTSDEFYDLVESLRTNGVTLQSIESIDADLERVFLKLTDKELDVSDSGGQSASELSAQRPGDSLEKQG